MLSSRVLRVPKAFLERLPFEAPRDPQALRRLLPALRVAWGLLDLPRP